MPLPFALDHINLWLIEDVFEGTSGFTVIDTGVSTPETRAHWQGLIEKKFQGRPIVRVICTHMHPDHLGLAYWLCAGLPDEDKGEGRWQAPLWMTLGEFTTGRIFSSKAMAQESESAPDGEIATMAEHFRRHGMTSDEDYDKARKRKSHFPSLVPRVPSRYQRLLPHQQISLGGQAWSVIPGYGHSPEHAALYCQALGILISGDMVLPRISTNMSVWAHEPDADPLGMYLRSLTYFEPLADEVLVLPSHGKPFGGSGMSEVPKTPDSSSLGKTGGSPVAAHRVRTHSRAGGLHTRLQQLHDHHEERLEKILSHCTQPRSCAEVLPLLFPRALDFHQFTFAMGETIAHMNHLWHQGIVRRSFAEGHYRFQRI
jgi:glyoxylase-like metal-dependent hydrolase (beta-lactamase superfamily II)